MTTAQLTGTARAVVFAEFGPPDVLEVVEIPVAEPGAGEVRVRVHAAFVAFGRDVSTRSGVHPVFRRLVTLPHILGGEHAGVVEAVGAGVDERLLGRRVAVAAPITCSACDACRDGRPWDCASVTAVGIQHPGSYSEVTIVPAVNVTEIPDAVDFADAAALSASGPLAWEELDVGALAPGETVFIPGASGSVGMMLVSLASRRGALVIAGTRGRRAAAALEQLGAAHVVDTGDPQLAETLRAHSPHGVDLVVDNVTDPALWDAYWPAVAKRGRIVTAGQASGHGERLPIDVVAFYNRRATFTGLVIGDPRSVTRFWEEMHVEPIVVPPTTIRTFPLEAAADAHRHIESGAKVGHLVLTVA